MSGSCESAEGVAAAAGGGVGAAGLAAALPAAAAGAGFAVDAVVGRAGVAAPVVVAAGLAGPGSVVIAGKTKSNGCSRCFSGSYLILAETFSGIVASCCGILASSVLPSRDGASVIVAASLPALSRTTAVPLKVFPASGFLKLS